MKQFVFITRLLLVFCISFLCLEAQAGSVARDRHTIRIGFSEFPPLRMGTNPGSERGIETDFLRELCRRMHLEPEFVHAPFVRNLKFMEEGHIDLMIGVLRRTERESYMHYLQPAYSTGVRYVFCVRSGKEDMLRCYEDLQGRVIGVTNGARYFPRFDTDASLSKDSVRTIYQNIDKLLKDRVDVFISEETTARYILGRKGLETSIAFAPYRFEQPQDVFITLSRQSQFAHRREEFARHLAGMKESGVMATLYQNFFDAMVQEQ